MSTASIHSGTEVAAKRHELRRSLYVGPPKGGKSTISLYSPGPILVVHTDIGSSVVPPGVDPDTVTFITYDEDDAPLTEGTYKFDRKRDVADTIRNHQNAIVTQMKALCGMAATIEIDGRTIPRPKTIVVDGVVRWAGSILDAILDVNQKWSPSDFKDPRHAWGDRLAVLGKMIRRWYSVNCNVILTCWDEPILKQLDRSTVDTGFRRPNIGGQLDIHAPGMANDVLDIYSRVVGSTTHYYARVRGGTLQGVGCRGRYSGPDEFDVTIGTSELNPYEKIFGRLEE